MYTNEKLQSVLNEIDSLNPFDTFDKLYDKSSDAQVMHKVINEVKKYNVFDFIARVSALNLIPENQNKSILFDALIAALLTVNRSEYTSIIKMSNGKFRNIINQISSMNLRMAIDPAENMFIENVMFYGNYNIFTGINYLPGYCLQKMVETLFLKKNDFNIAFLKTASKLIIFVLTISDIAVRKLDYNIEEIKKIESDNIVIPDSGRHEYMAELVSVENELIKKLLDDDPIIQELYSDFAQGDLESTLIANKQNFDSKPFIMADGNKTIVLNISVLASFTMHKIICLADRYGSKADLINAYNGVAWTDCRRSLSLLDHKKISEKTWGIDLREQEDYKEVLLNVFNNQVMIVTFICDDGRGYTEDSIFDIYPDDKFGKIIEERISYFHDKLSLHNVTAEDIFHIAIINSFGRSIMVGLNKKHYYRSLALNPFDLKCISINEKTDSAFLPRYIRSRNKLQSTPTVFSELNTIEIYVSNQYSFYINDDFNPKESVLYIGPGDSIDYIIGAIKKEKRHLVESYNDDFFTEVILVDRERNIYTNIDHSVPRASLLVEFFNVSIWICTPEITEVEGLNLYFSITDAISYWLGECKEIIEYHTFNFKAIKLVIELAGDFKEYYYDDLKDNLRWIDKVSFKGNANTITLTWTSEAFKLLKCADNSIEKQMAVSILEELGKLAVEKEINEKQIEMIFANPLKKKFFHLDYMKHPYLKPMQDRNFRIIKSEDENELLDDIGRAILTSGKWSYGIIKDTDRSIIANYIVGYLYDLLKKQIEELQPTNLVELVCFDLETVMYDFMLAQNRYAYDVVCYPEKQEEILHDFNELNKTSKALKFFAEYVSACPPSGTKVLGEWQYDKMLAICSLIIDWAYNNDLFYYKIFNTPIEILKSDRVGMKQKEFIKLHAINFKAREEQLNHISTSNLKEKFSHQELPNFEEELNIAFLDEYLYSFEDFYKSILGIISYGDLSDDEVKKANKDELISWLVENNPDINSDKIERVIQYVSLTKRGDYLKPDKPFRKEDVYPWRFNRELSFTRRPIIIRNNEMIWGNRQLYHTLTFTLDLIYEGKLKSRGKKLTELIGRISNKRGSEFNTRVFNRIQNIEDFIVDKNLKKINHKNIADSNGNTLGDIDILYIIPKKKRIILAEVKDFNFSKSPYEMNIEYQNMFLDNGDRKCFATKHQRRALWIKEHLNDVKIQYNLVGDGWSVKDIFIVNEPIISNAFYDAGATIITYAEISKDRLQRV